MHKNVAILGCGAHFERYQQAFFFYPGIGNVTQITLNDITQCESDIIVVAEPFLLRSVLPYLPKSSSQIVICEKLPFRESEDYYYFCKHYSDLKIFFVHTRCYENKYYPLYQNNLKIEWPNLYYSNMDPVWNTLPNILDWLFRQKGSFPDISDSQLEFKGNIVIFKTRILNDSYTFSIIEGKETDKIVVEGVPYDWPNYVLSYHAFLDQLFHGEIVKEENHKYTLREIEFIKILIEGIKNENY